jgi:hypothetical protein
MKNCNPPENQTTRRILPIACTTALAVALAGALPQLAHADRIVVPHVPFNIAVEAGNKPFLEGHGVGTQNYICLPDGTGFAYKLFTPEATLFNHGDRQQVTTHYFSPNNNPFDPANKGVITPTWQHSRDSSTVWAAATAMSTDANFVALGAIPWVLLKVTGVQDGPTHGDRLSATTFIQRLNTIGGSAPSDGCAQLVDVGRKAFVPYSADYFFYFNPDADNRQ